MAAARERGRRKMRLLALLALLALAGAMPARAEGEQAAALPGEIRTPEPYAMRGRVREDMPEMTFALYDEGEAPQGHSMRLDIAAEDGSFAQSLTYWGREAVTETLLPATLADVNFDGCADLDLTVSFGPSNRMSVVALWSAELGRFAEPDMDTELCNYTLEPEKNLVVSSVAQGVAWHTTTVYRWEGGVLQRRWQGEIYRPEDDAWIGERLVSFAPDGTRAVCWDQLYPVEWYDGARVRSERDEVLQRAMTDGLLESAPEARVVNAAWVNLRQCDSKASPSLAAIDNESYSLCILRRGCGEDDGWTRVYAVPKDGGQALTGYIWFSFLEEMR